LRGLWGFREILHGRMVAVDVFGGIGVEDGGSCREVAWSWRIAVKDVDDQVMIA
jgi:hypothetical protein